MDTPVVAAAKQGFGYTLASIGVFELKLESASAWGFTAFALYFSQNKPAGPTF